ncbi:MAG: hypothetical protein B7X59_00575 [Polaromonas sp. 39-63-203]|jgi:hypothetical protein|uniref:hypothetical protein n=1 Tax=Polaromonas sp. TaxID=1869339 RepID=UPI000BCAA91E|nr:hypothetical protein [Polaromonas sp.]OYY53726.1 MAG: hypothetical protein B7Y54_01910 [Polaromonas sp. 35-63-240]OYZ03433.1 MAG: hypothetical protein B7Y42_00760 [Polaromonas sp. 28-63-22]OYZ85262.1 MAG: hypothetical protein B7Y03_00250 [Polaromonas sp. 24-62-144]OZB02436.1 MAG: hypothetical protein B7X59_00575 [Polaromonas sp. 39-63-203]HQS31405.1 hypothetical protein [Polaromonas sp.]
MALGLSISMTLALLVSTALVYRHSGAAQALDAKATQTLARQQRVAGALAAYAARSLIDEERDIAAMDGLVLWLDGADVDTQFSDTSGYVPAGIGDSLGLWRDKSGRGHHLLQALGDLQPTVDQQASRRHISLLPNQGLASAVAQVNYDGATSFVVWQAPLPVTSRRLLTHQTSSPVPAVLGWELSGDRLRWRSGGSTGTDTYQNGVSGVWQLSTGINDASGGRQWLSGANPDPSASVLGTRTLAGEFRVGSDNDLGAASVRIAEVLHFSRPLADGERQRVEGYLAHKWDLAAALTSSHPYRTPHPMPCPSDPAAATAGRYNAYDDSGLETRDAVTGACAVQLGLLPWQTLGLQRREAFDAYGRPWTYAVTPTVAATVAARRSEFCGQTTGRLNAGADPQRLGVSATGDADGPTVAAQVLTVALVSHGANGRGAYGPNRSRTTPPAGAADRGAMEVRNYDEASGASQARQLVAARVTLEPGAAQFDDLVWVATPAALLLRLPSRARCP